MGNKYTTSTKVKEEIPGSLPESLTDAKIEGYIEDASRYIDARLPNYAGFSDIGSSPSTPRIIEKITRYLSVHDCLVFMGEMRGDPTTGSEMRNLAENLLDDLYPKDGTSSRAMIPPDEYDYSQTPSSETIKDSSGETPHSFYSTTIKRKDYPKGDVED